MYRTDIFFLRHRGLRQIVSALFVFSTVICQAKPKPSNFKTNSSQGIGDAGPSTGKKEKWLEDNHNRTVADLMQAVRERIIEKKWNWDLSFFHDQGWQVDGRSVRGYPLIYWKCGTDDAKAQANVSLILSSVHGDEVTPVYFGFRVVEWLKARPELCAGRNIIVAPLVNPDGFLRYTNGTRTNWNKVDLNRNLPSPDWTTKAHMIWKTSGQSQRRYYPGDTAGSEPETQFQQRMIDTFKPIKIMTVHAPLNMMDYDGPSTAQAQAFTKKYIDSCEILKSMIKKATPSLRFEAYGNFPGSLGNYAGIQKGIPTLTAELPTADPSLAGLYFGQLEAGTKVFVDYELKGRIKE